MINKRKIMTIKTDIMGQTTHMQQRDSKWEHLIFLEYHR